MFYSAVCMMMKSGKTFLGRTCEQIGAHPSLVLAVVHASSTLHRCRTTGTARCVSATVWFIAVVVTTALEFSSSCVLLPALFYLTILEFLLPLLAVVGFTLRVACFLSSSHGPMPQQSRARRARAVRLLATVLVVFTICFTPFHVRQVLVYFRVKVRGEGLSQAGHILAYHITVTLSSLNSCLDPVVYCFVTDSLTTSPISAANMEHSI